ncbi:MAG: SPASM domain-containing protein [Alistipes onderdonkii]
MCSMSGRATWALSQLFDARWRSGAVCGRASARWVRRAATRWSSSTTATSTRATISSTPVQAGNIRDALAELYRSQKRRNGLDKRNTLPAECLRCNYYFACRGECPKHRFLGPTAAPNSLCEGLKRYFRHVEPYMEYMRDLLARQQSPAWVMPFARRRMGLM